MVKNQRKIGVLLSYIGQGIHMASGVIYTPIMLRLLGQSEYGLYQLVYSIISYLGLLNFGFAGSYMRFYAKAEKGNNSDEISNLNGIFLIIFLLISIICFICGMIMTFNIEWIFSTGLKENEYSKAKILMLLMTINLSLSLFANTFSCNVIAKEQFVFQGIVSILYNLFNPIITLPLLLMGYGSISLVIVTTLLTFFYLISNMVYSIKKCKMKFSFNSLRVDLFKELGLFTFFIFLNQIIDKINWSLDKVLLGRFKGTIEVAIYGVAANLNLMYQNFLGIISSVFVPQVNRIENSKAKNKDENITDVFIKVSRIQFFIAFLIVSGFVFFGKIFIELWAGKEYGNSYYVGLLLIISISMELIQSLGVEIQKAKNMHQTRTLVYFVISIFNIFISIPLIKKYRGSWSIFGYSYYCFYGKLGFYESLLS